MSNILGMRIKSLREYIGLSQLELAKHLNVSNTTLSQYESGQRIPSDDIKIKIATFFNVSVDYLLGRVDKKIKVEPDSPPLSQEQQDLLTATSDLSSDDLKKALEYVELLKLKHKP